MHDIELLTLKIKTIYLLLQRRIKVHQFAWKKRNNPHFHFFSFLLFLYVSTEVSSAQLCDY